MLSETGVVAPAVVIGVIVVAIAFVSGCSVHRPTTETSDRSAVPPGMVRIEVVDHSGLFEDEAADRRHDRPPLFLASSANGWDPAGQPSDGSFRDKVDDGGGNVIRPGAEAPGGWWFLVPREEAERIAFKFTRGSWATVEVGMNGQDIENRTLPRLGNAEGRRADFIRLELAGFIDQRGERWPDLAEPGAPPTPSVIGTLEVDEVAAPALGGSRTVRVWLPASYARDADRRYPVLYMHDGQNCFDNATASFGVEWGCDETATRLAEEGRIPEMIIVALDNSPNRSAEYNAPSARFRGVTPVGDMYVDWLVDEVMPWVERRFRVRTGPEHTALGGSSFGGNITLYAMMRRPGVFGRALVESPAVPVVGPGFMREIQQHPGPWARGVFLAMGTEETANAAYNRRLVEIMDELRSAFEDDGLTEANGRLRVVVEDGGRHNEAAWVRRLPDAFTFLFGE